MPLVARYADGWNVPIGVSPESVKRRLDIILSPRSHSRGPHRRLSSFFLSTDSGLYPDGGMKPSHGREKDDLDFAAQIR